MTDPLPTLANKAAALRASGDPGTAELIDRAIAEIERLREALGQVAGGRVFQEMRFFEDDDAEYYSRRERKVMLFARAALGDQP